MEVQTEEAYRIPEQQSKEGMTIPEDCLMKQFTIFLDENIDSLEETLSGMHEMQHQ